MARWLIGLLLVLGWCSQAQAQWNFVGERASASWTLAYTISDLNPDDGVGAAMRAFMGERSRETGLGGGDAGAYKHAVAPDFRVVRGSSPELVNSMLWSAVDATYTDAMWFELTPYTQLTVTGTLSAEATSPPTEVLPFDVTCFDPSSSS